MPSIVPSFKSKQEYFCIHFLDIIFLGNHRCRKMSTVFLGYCTASEWRKFSYFMQSYHTEEINEGVWTGATTVPRVEKEEILHTVQFFQLGKEKKDLASGYS